MNKKTVMVTGNLGYIGNVMVPYLTDRGIDVIGYDAGYYEQCYLASPKQHVNKQIIKDVRDCEVEDFEGVDAVIHLAGISNDPLGDFNEAVTYQINYEGSIRLALKAKEAGVRRFLYASSQSVYGISDTDIYTDEDGVKNPITAYAKSKWMCENELRRMASEDFFPIVMRPATAYGASPNMRCDIVFNGFVANAVTTGNIIIKSDGSPVRPMSHVQDISAAFYAALEAPQELVFNEVFNIGTSDNNYTVRELAEIACKYADNCQLTFTGEHTDPRSYRVSSDKILTRLKDYYKPSWDIDKAGKELVSFFSEVEMSDELFNSWKCSRLKCLRKRIDEGSMQDDFRVISTELKSID